MAVSVTETGNKEFVLNLINSTELQKLFFELKDNIQIKVLNTAFRKSGKIILDTAKINFNSTKKGLSKTGYAGFSSSFKSKPLKEDVGMVFGMQHREGYKYRFLNFGTKERFTRYSNLSRGVIKPSKFFTDAVKAKADKAQSMLSDEIIKSLDNLVRKYDR